MAFTYYTDNALLNEMFGGVAFTPPATLYIGLSTSTPTASGTGATEPSGNAYARVAVVNNATNFPNAANGTKTNGTTITFPQATGSWGTVTYFVIYDAASAGNLIGFGALNNSQTVSNGDTLSFATSAMTLTLN
ncbi:MAG: hypothetical protein Q8910_00930 [Bacteroidota bacterium]|nr:hypothetical protein [Bacteroidota bacterium]